MKNAAIFTLLFGIQLSGVAQVTAYKAPENLKYSQANPGLFLDDWEARTMRPIKKFKPRNQTSEIPSVHVTLYGNDTITKVSKHIFSNNANSWMGKPSEPMMQHLLDLEMGALRFPGGDFSNEYFFDAMTQADMPPNTPDTIYFEKCGWKEFSIPFTGADDQGWRLNPQGYYDLLRELKIGGSICVNYSYARYNTAPTREQRVNEAADYAAKWVREVNKKQRLGVKFWEIGNENLGIWEAGYHVPGLGVISGKEYGEDIATFAQKMKEVDPTIKIGAYVYEDAPEHGFDDDKVMFNWNRSLLPEVLDHADYLIMHSYFTPYGKPVTAEQMWSYTDKIPGFVDQIYGDIERYTDKNPTDFPIVVTEFNTFSNAKVNEAPYCSNVSHAAGVFFTLTLGKFIQHGFGQTMMWDLINGFAEGDDHGMFAAHEADVPMHNPHPSFFNYYYFKNYFGDVMIKSEVSSDNLEVFASKFESGQSGTIIVNKTDKTEYVEIDFKDFDPGKRYFWYTLENPEPWSRKVLINGNESDANAGGPVNYKMIKPLSSELVNGKMVFTAPAYSANFIIIENK